MNDKMIRDSTTLILFVYEGHALLGLMENISRTFHYEYISVCFCIKALKQVCDLQNLTFNHLSAGGAASCNELLYMRYVLL